MTNKLLQQNTTSLLHTYSREIAHYTTLSPEEESIILERLCAGDHSARERLIHSYLRLVVSIARHPKLTRLAEVMDLIQEGNIGLIQAVDSYNLNAGCRFDTFAMVCIRNRILSFIQQTGKVLLVLDKPVFEDADEYITHADRVVDEATVLGDASFLNVEEMMLREEWRTALLAAMDRLHWKEREVLQLLYGVGVRRAMTVQEVSLMLGVSKVRVGQIRIHALRQLKRCL